MRTRIASLDGLRAISIALVIGSHALGDIDGVWTPLGVLRSQNLGALGVRVFFVISGFLITSLLLAERRQAGRIDLAAFYLRRTLRIFPPYYALLAVVVTLNAAGLVALTGRDMLHAMTYTVNYFPQRAWVVGHAWSLSVEEQFYLLWPAVLILVGTRRALWAAAGAVALCPLVRLTYWYAQPALIRYEVGYRFETVIDSIAIGCLLAGAYDRLEATPRYRAALRSRVLLAAPLLVLAAAMLSERTRSSLLLGVTLQNVGIAACIAWCVTNPAGRVGRVLNGRAVVFVGTLSYSLYLWQQLFFQPSMSWPLTLLPVKLGLAVGAALVSYYLVERPALRLRLRLEAWRPPAAGAPAGAGGELVQRAS